MSRRTSGPISIDSTHGDHRPRLQNDQWIDVPLVYKSGRRAMMTLEKGAFGNFAFNGAVSAWRWRAGMAETDTAGTPR